MSLAKGTLAQIVAPGADHKHLIGKRTMIIGHVNGLNIVHHPLKRGSHIGAIDSALQPVAYDGNKKVKWEECAWSPHEQE